MLDILIPNDPSVLTYAERICALQEVDAVSLRVMEVDDRTKTLALTIDGDALSFEAVEQAIGDVGGSIHSIDEVSAVSD